MKQIISILLSVLLLASSSGITYAQHFCGDYEMISKLALGQAYLSCGMVVQDDACSDEQAEDHDCCDNDYTQIHTDDTRTSDTLELQISPDFVTAYVAVFQLKLSVVDAAEKSFYSEYSPPPLIKDISVLYETFLI